MTPEREADIYATVLRILRDSGYEALTLERVAARTRCSKATLYRRWSGKPDLVVSAIRHEMPDVIGTIDTGSLIGDLHALTTLEDVSAVHRRSTLIRSVATAARKDPSLLQAVHEHLIAPQAAALHRMVQHAVDRGEVDPDCPALPFVPTMILGAAIVHDLFDDQAPTPLDAYITAVVLPALRHAPARQEHPATHPARGS
ncbi:TetR/AcrR family transcriptional regulator [Streptomyces sp. NPDC026665]|uniref:TetR/AcrR family transcriptional regulator n=1 Tax=Streptomyces sp. NPDC026665 TaxID=3154798 RepID=UPI0033CE326B